jgi:predicted dehydrogenase/threonine dehydrogenase-like Zn-dependent dehydrogenase
MGLKQVLQDIKKGNTSLVTAPSPKVSKGKLLIHTCNSLISTGTERMLVDFGKASYLQKARQQPEKVAMVLEKIKTDGLLTTIEAVQSKLDQPLPSGYCNVGIVAEVGEDVQGFQIGDRVVSNGPHADIVHISQNLCSKIPDQVDDEQATFTVVASIALQGLRLAQPTLGECFVVTGVGLIGLLAVQLLRAHGCRVLAIDLDDKKLQLAKEFGAEICNPSLGEDPVATGMAFSRSHGVDGVIITASTKSNDPMTQAARMCRKRGRIVLVGVTGLELNRADFYEKELSFQVSCSYGPGRYDPEYEEKGLDYPIGFVRWTEQRNFEAVLDMLSSGQLNIKPLITHTFDFEDSPLAYQKLTADNSCLGIILKYTSEPRERAVHKVDLKNPVVFDSKKPILGVIGAGNYAARVLLPACKKAGAQCHTLVTSGGINAVIQGNKIGFAQASTDIDALLANPEINTVVIATRHNSHASLVVKALNAGKQVFVEKPLAINLQSLAEVEAAYHSKAMTGEKPRLMVGFNRRFAPQIQKMKSLLQPLKTPKAFIMTVNAGFIPADHWTQNLELGGGRIIGEACHFIDLMRYLADSPIISIQVKKMGTATEQDLLEDKAVITLGFEEGSFGSIHYLANGAASFPKERIEVFAGGRVLQLNNFRKMSGYNWPGFKKMNLWRQDKGQNNCISKFLTSIELGLSAPIPVEEIFEVSKFAIEAANLLRGV